MEGIYFRKATVEDCYFIICNSSSDENIGWIMYEIKDKQCNLHLIALKQEEIGKNFGYQSLL